MKLETDKTVFLSEMGHNGFQYPNMNRTRVLQAGTNLTRITWPRVSNYCAYIVTDHPLVVWMEAE
jgi:hypothetical protein